MDYVCKKYPEAKFIMLATWKEYNPVNYSNYVNNGMPVPTPEGGYMSIPMRDVDHIDHDDIAFDRRVGDDAAWELWVNGDWQFTGKMLKNGKRDKNQGTKIPLSGGYGFEKHTLVAELPFFFGHKNTK